MQLIRINDKEFALSQTPGNEAQDAKELAVLNRMVEDNRTPILRVATVKRGMVNFETPKEQRESQIFSIVCTFAVPEEWKKDHSEPLSHVDVTPEEARKLCAQLYNLHNDEIVEVATNFGKITFHCIEK